MVKILVYFLYNIILHTVYCDTVRMTPISQKRRRYIRYELKSGGRFSIFLIRCAWSSKIPLNMNIAILQHLRRWSHTRGGPILLFEWGDYQRVETRKIELYDRIRHEISEQLLD